MEDRDTHRSEITEGYLRSLGVPRSAPDLELLRELTSRHVATFAFCSVGPRLGEDLPLDCASLYERIVVRRRGGYCFEQNGLFFEMLQELGFAVRLYLGRVIYDQDTHPGLTHRITMVDLEDELYVADVGFGPLGPRFPVPMSGQESIEGHRVFRISERSEGEFHMQTLKDGGFFSLYRFELARYGQADCELGHFFSHRHAKATFVNHLVVSRILGGEVRSLRNRVYWIIKEAEETVEEISEASRLRALLHDELGVRVTDSESQYLFEISP